jgi:hypothetical protein
MDNKSNQINQTKIISDKNGMKLIRLLNNEFNFTCTIENKTIHLDKIINFDLIKLIFEINNDIYEKVIMNKTDDDNAEFVFIMKHFFADIGLPQRYYHFIMTKNFNESENKIVFTSETIYNQKPNFIDKDIEFLPIKNMIYDCQFNSLQRDKMLFSALISFDKNLPIPEYIEKVVGLIVHKIFIRVKQFIENYRV